DNAFLVSRKQVLVDARHVVVALGEGERRHFDQVFEARKVSGQEREVKPGVAAAFGFALLARGGRDIGFVADDRVDSGGSAFLVKLDGAKQIAVIGYRQGVHSQG